MPIVFETTLNKLRSLPGSFDLSGLSDISLQYETDLDALGRTSGAWTYTSIASDEVIVENGGFTATLTGTGFSPVSSISQLEAAINDGIATGDFDTLTFDRGNTEIARLEFDTSGITITSGNSELELTGDLPGSFDEVFDLLDAWDAIQNFGDLSTSAQNGLITDMEAISLEGLIFRQNNDSLLELTLGDDGGTLVAGGLELTLDGTVPTTLGDLLGLAQEVLDQQVETLDWWQTQIRFLDDNGVELPPFETIQQGNLTYYTNYNNYGDSAYYSGAPLLQLIQIEISSDFGGTGFYSIEVNVGNDSSETIVTETDIFDPLPQMVSGSVVIQGTIEDANDVDTYMLALPPFDGLNAYTTGDEKPINAALLTELALNGGSLGIEGAAAPIFTIGGDIAAALLGGEENPGFVVNGQSYENVSLDLDLDGQSGNTRDGLSFQNDLALGYGGDDTILGYDGDDFIDGGADDDSLSGGYDNDTLLGQNGDDRLEGGRDDDSIVGGNGNDTLIGGSGFDTLRGGNGDDTVNGGDGKDTAYLGGGNDLFVDNAQGGANGRDTVYGNGGNDTINGGNGDDRFLGQDGADRLLGRKGNDKLFGGNQNDTMVGGDGNDIVAGGNGRDKAFMGNGNDKWFDNEQTQFGDDLVVAGAGNDTIEMHGGNDTATGGGGADEFHFIGSAFGDDVVTDFQIGTDRLGIDGGLMNLTQAALDAISDTSSGSLVLTFSADASITFENLSSNAGLLADIFEL